MSVNSQAYYQYLKLKKKTTEIINFLAEIEAANHNDVNLLLKDPNIQRRLNDYGINPIKFYTVTGFKLPVAIETTKDEFDLFTNEWKASLATVLQEATSLQESLQSVESNTYITENKTFNNNWMTFRVFIYNELTRDIFPSPCNGLISFKLGDMTTLTTNQQTGYLFEYDEWGQHKHLYLNVMDTSVFTGGLFDQQTSSVFSNNSLIDVVASSMQWKTPYLVSQSNTEMDTLYDSLKGTPLIYYDHHIYTEFNTSEYSNSGSIETTSQTTFTTEVADYIYSTITYYTFIVTDVHYYVDNHGYFTNNSSDTNFIAIYDSQDSQYADATALYTALSSGVTEIYISGAIAVNGPTTVYEYLPISTETNSYYIIDTNNYDTTPVTQVTDANAYNYFLSSTDVYKAIVDTNTNSTFKVLMSWTLYPAQPSGDTFTITSDLFTANSLWRFKQWISNAIDQTNRGIDNANVDYRPTSVYRVMLSDTAIDDPFSDPNNLGTSLFGDTQDLYPSNTTERYIVGYTLDATDTNIVTSAQVAYASDNTTYTNTPSNYIEIRYTRTDSDKLASINTITSALQYVDFYMNNNIIPFIYRKYDMSDNYKSVDESRKEKNKEALIAELYRVRDSCTTKQFYLRNEYNILDPGRNSI